MTWLPIFIDEQDKKALLRWLNQQEEIAFIVPTGLKQWKAVSTVDDLPNGRHLLWHTPGGRLPRLVAERGEYWFQEEDEEPVLTQWQANNLEGFIVDPWSGWTEETIGAEASVPYFGAGSPCIIDLDIQTQHELYSECRMVEGVIVKERSIYEENKIGLSGFCWRGGRYEVTPQQTLSWWEKMKQWVAAEAKLLADFPEKRDEEKGELEEAWGFYAFPSAYQALKSGIGYNANGFDLTEGLR